MLMLAMTIFIMCDFSACSDDIPVDKPADVMCGLWTDATGRYIDIVDIDHIYEYHFVKDEGEDYCLKYRQTYLYEPNSDLVMMDDTEGKIHVYKLMGVNDSEMTLCWLDDPVITSLDGDGKYEFLSVFFRTDYVVDPANNMTFTRADRETLEKKTAQCELIEM